MGGGAGAGYWGGYGGDVDNSNDAQHAASGGAGGSNFFDSSVGSVTQNQRGEGNSGDGEIVIEIERPEAASNLSSSAGDGQIELSWDASPDDVDSYQIHRDTDPNIDPSDATVIDEVAGSTTSYSDTNVDDGRNYYYVVTAATEFAASEPTGEVTEALPLPAPTGLVATAVDRDTISLEWTDNTAGEDGYRVHGAPAGETFEEIADLDPDTESYTVEGLLDGREYTYYVEVYAGSTTKQSSEESATTPIPDVDAFLLDASVQDELTITFEEDHDNGRYRIRWRRSVDDAYDSSDEATIPYDADPLQYTVSGLLDGELYDVGVRVETDDVDGSYHTAEEITKLVAADGIGAANVTETGLELTWTVNSDFEGGQQIWRRRADYTYEQTDGPGELIATTDETASSYVEDDTLHPGRGYEYTVRAVTQYVHADGSGAVSTESAGLEQSAVPPRGWHVEIDHPSGTVLTPRVLDDAERRPTLNEQSRVEIPVPRDETWLSDALDDQPMRVWKDGRRLPIDTLADRSTEPGHVVLEATGGKQLERRVREDVEVEASHDLIERLIEENTDYTANVDAPDIEETEDVVQDVWSVAEWETALGDTIDQLDTLPITLDAGVLDQLPTCSQADGVDGNDGDGDWTPGTEYSGAGIDTGNGAAAAITGDDVGDDPESFEGMVGAWDLETYHTIPEKAVEIPIRLEDTDDKDFEIELRLDDNVLFTFDHSGSAFPFVGWRDMADDSNGWVDTGWTYGDLEPGTHTLEMEVLSGGSGSYLVDRVSIADGRYEHTFDNDPTWVAETGRNALDGPEAYAVETVTLDPFETVLSVISGSLEADFNSVAGDQKVGITNAGSDALVEVSNSSTVSTEWPDPGDRVQVELTLSGWPLEGDGEGPQGETPRYGYNGQSVAGYTLSAVLDDTPLVIDQSYDDNLMAIIADVAEDSNSISEVGWDDAAGTMSVEWCQPGQRSAGHDLDVVDYTTTKVVPGIQKAIVYGAAQSVRDERFTATVGDPVSLEEQDLVPGTTAVRDSDGVRFRRGNDYELDRQTGTITALEDGDLEDSSEYLIDYEWKTRGEYESGYYSGDPREELVETISPLTSERACAQAAKQIVDHGSQPRTEADVTLPPSIPADLSLVEALDLDIPGDAMAIYELEESPEGLQLRLGERERVRETVRRLERRAEDVSQRV